MENKTVIINNVSIKFESSIITEENKKNLTETIIDNINYYLSENFPNLNPQISIGDKNDIIIK